MDVRNWRNSGRDRADSVNSPSARLKKLRYWKVFWMELLNERRKIFNSATQVQVPYDEFSYLQNFDQGSAPDDPDILRRSFTVRFADPWKTTSKTCTMFGDHSVHQQNASFHC